VNLFQNYINSNIRISKKIEQNSEIDKLLQKKGFKKNSKKKYKNGG